MTTPTRKKVAKKASSAKAAVKRTSKKVAKKASSAKTAVKKSVAQRKTKKSSPAKPRARIAKKRNTASKKDVTIFDALQDGLEAIKETILPTSKTRKRSR